MKRLILFILIMPAIMFAQNSRRNLLRQHSMISDIKAGKIGDAVTIVILESSKASNQAQKSTSKKSDLGLDAGASMGGEDTFPETEVDIGSRNNFNGGGSAKSQGSIKAKISAMVDSVLTNGNLHISGSQKITIYGEEQTIEIKGIVRPIDIKADNSVYSYNISNAEIIFDGKGKIEDSQEPGWLTKILHWIF